MRSGITARSDCGQVFSGEGRSDAAARKKKLYEQRQIVYWRVLEQVHVVVADVCHSLSQQLTARSEKPHRPRVSPSQPSQGSSCFPAIGIQMT